MERATQKTRDAERWVRTHGDALYRHALLRVREGAVAEDLVQETLLAAWKSTDENRDRDERLERGWLMGILRHKIADHYRAHARDQTPYDPAMLATLEESQFSA